MREILEDVERWRGQGEAVAVATVIQTWGSAPRQPGAKMAWTAGGSISGSVSGGCVENAVVESGARTLATGRPQRLRFGVSDETAWGVGLACGGTIEVLVEPLATELFDPIREALLGERPAATATVIGGGEELLGRKLFIGQDGTRHGTIGKRWDDAVASRTRSLLSERSAARVEEMEGIEVFIETLLPPPRLIIVGGVHIAVPLVSLAKTLGYRTVIVDPRRAFGNPDRFPHADRIVSDWPDRALEGLEIDRSTAIAVLTHDPKLDDPALSAALRSPAFYVGALGSGRTQERRRQRLLQAGLGEEALARLYGPIGLPLGGRSPEEIALSILAQIVKERNRSHT